MLEDKIMEIFESQQVKVLGSEQTTSDLQFSKQERIFLEILDMVHNITLYMILN